MSKEVNNEIFPFTIESKYFYGTVYTEQDLEDIVDEFPSKSILYNLKMTDQLPSYLVFKDKGKGKPLEKYLYE